MDTEPTEALSISEGELAARLGVSRETLTHYRTELLLVEKDWGRKKNAVVYYEAGVSAVCLALGLEVPPALLSAAVIVAGVQAQDGGPVAVFVKRVARLNRRMIFVTEKKDDALGAEIPVRVRDAQMFVPGQEIRITRPAGELASLFGPQPRGRGRHGPGRRRARTP